MIDNKGMLSISNQQELNTALNTLISQAKKRHDFGKQNSEFIKKNKGAVVQILNYLRT